jgi:predicted transcriptional regulator
MVVHSLNKLHAERDGVRKRATRRVAAAIEPNDEESTTTSTTSETLPDHELDVLSHIHADTEVKQRDIAHAIGLSLGMTNSILKRLATKGLLTIRRINSRNVHYLVTPEGVDLIARRSYRYLRRTVGHVVRYKERLWELLNAAAAPDSPTPATGVVLAGTSDIDFVVEWCAGKAGLPFRRVDCSAGGPDGADGADCRALANDGEFVVAAESLPIDCSCDLHLAKLVFEAKRR